jgi:hypothetical protein
VCEGGESMNVLEKLPGMTDEALGNLHANA